MKKKIYRNGKGGYGNLKATKSIKVAAIRAAYTSAALIACKLVGLKGKEYHLTGKAIERDALRGIMGSRAFGYWLNEKGWLEVTGDGIKVTANGVNTLNERYAGTGPTYNTNRDALRIVAHCMRTGDRGEIGYQPSEYEIEV